ncbi:MAG: hypothetical protein WA888_06030 [Burkholderiaceae bacterium]
MNSDENGLQVPAHEFQKLRRLLIAGEIAALEQLTEQVRRLNQRVGDNVAFRASVAQVLADALADTHQRDPSVLGAVVSPLVVQGMKDSTDDIVEVMYPLTGRMVASSVKNAIKTLSDKINAQIESRFAPRVILSGLRARIAGQAVSDILIADSNKPDVVRAMIFDKASGEILASWHSVHEQTGNYNNPELVSALMAALNNMAEETFESNTGGLRSLELDGKNIAIRRSGKHMVVLEVAGELHHRQEQQLDAAFVQAIETLNARDSKCGDTRYARASIALEQLVGAVLDGVRSQAGKAVKSDTQKSRRLARSHQTRLITSLAVALCCVLAWPLWSMLQDYRLDRDVANVQSLIRQHPQLMYFPVSAAPRYESGRIEITGLIPNGTDVRQLYQELSAASGRTLNFGLYPIVIAGQKAQ